MIAKDQLRKRLIGAMQRAGRLDSHDTISKEDWSGWIGYWCERTRQADEIRTAKKLSFEKANELGTWLGYPEIAVS